MIRGGWDRGPIDPGYFGVRVDVALPPLDADIEARRFFVEYGYDCSVVKKSIQQEAVRAIIAGRTNEHSAARAPYVTATLVTDETGRVHVDVGELRVGVLTSADSRRFCQMANAPRNAPALLRACRIHGERRTTDYSVHVWLQVR